MTNGKRRRMFMALLAFCLLLIVAIGWQMWTSLRSSTLLEYRDRYPLATPSELCPGETFIYPVRIDINQGDSVSRITENWCRVSDGICPDKYDREPPPYKGFVDPAHVEADATRMVPADMTPGVWQFRHCNETHSDGLIDVTCYGVTVTVKDCE